MVAGHSCQIALAIWIPELSRLLRQLHCNWLSIPFFKHMFPSFSTKWKENLGRGEGWGISTNRGDYCLFHLSRYPKTKGQQNKDLKKKGREGRISVILFIYLLNVSSLIAGTTPHFHATSQVRRSPCSNRICFAKRWNVNWRIDIVNGPDRRNTRFISLVSNEQVNYPLNLNLNKDTNIIRNEKESIGREKARIPFSSTCHRGGKDSKLKENITMFA